MHAQLIAIGNSKGVRLPAALLRQYQIVDEIELLPGKNEIIIRPVNRTARKGWDEAFEAMHHAGDDTLLPIAEDDLDTGEWEWN